MADRRLSILTVSPSETGGGAEMVAWALFDACRRRGHRMTMAVGRRTGVDPDVLALEHDRHRSGWARLWLRLAAAAGTPRLANIGQPQRWLSRRLGREDMDFPGTAHLLDRVGRPVDLLHAHNLHGLGGGFFDLRALPALAARVPVALTLHDAWMLAGHCAHSFDCDRWQTGCGSCPDITIPEAIRRDASAENWLRKKEIFQDCRLHVATPSQWLMDRVEQSLMAPAVRAGRVIPNGIDLDVFRPGDPGEARRHFGLEPEAVIVLCLGSALKTNRWKDFSAGLQAVEISARKLDKRITLLAVGEEAPRERREKTDLVSIGPLTRPAQVAAAMRTSDIFLHPAKVDTFPTAVLEAMACGLPVVASAVGGIPEQVVDGESGFLVPPGDVERMAECLSRCLLEADTARRMGENALDRATREFGLSRMVDQYTNWFGGILESNRSTSRTGNL